MIRGWFPLVCLWASVAGLWVSFALILVTPWRLTLVGRLLAGYIAVPAAWWTLVLAGSYAGVPKPLEVAEGVAFTLIPVVVWCMVAVQFRARWHRLAGWRHEKEPAK